MDAIFIARILICAFFAVCFLQSGLDKVVDWKGNLEWITGHFGKTFLRRAVPAMLLTVTFTELLGGLLSVVGGVILIFGGAPQVAMWAMAVVGLNLVMLFGGQRIAKDYPGAAVLASYFLVALVGLTLMQSSGS